MVANGWIAGQVPRKSNWRQPREARNIQGPLYWSRLMIRNKQFPIPIVYAHYREPDGPDYIIATTY